MEKEEALKNLDMACQKFTGTRGDHKILLESLDTIRKELGLPENFLN